jgi:protein-disulfide isomerase
VNASRKRLLLLAGVAAAALVAVVVAIVVSSGGSSPGSGTTTSTEASSSFLVGVPQQGDTLGKPTAPATLVVFEDPQCPFCKEWSVGALPTVVDRFVKTGKVKLVWRGIEIIGPNSLPGLRAAYAAANQNRLWNLVDALYRRQGSENSGWITDGLLKDAAKEAGVNPTAMLAASPSRKVTAALRNAATEATQDNVQGTPTFILIKPPAVAQQLQVTSLDPTQFSDSLSAALR